MVAACLPGGAAKREVLLHNRGCVWWIPSNCDMMEGFSHFSQSSTDVYCFVLTKIVHCSAVIYEI